MRNIEIQYTLNKWAPNTPTKVHFDLPEGKYVEGFVAQIELINGTIIIYAQEKKA